MSQALLKNAINTSSIAHIASLLLEVEPEFPASLFKQKAAKGLNALELKERVYHIITVLHQTLPSDFKKTAKLLTRLKKIWRCNKEERHDFTAWPIIDYVSIYGIDHPKIALPLLQRLTSLFSSEFAVRPFIEQHPELTWVHLHKWAEHKDEHVRRLASESCRPRLPWGSHLQELLNDPMPIISLLNKLKDDDSEYVRRSVANNLNDIAKNHPDLIIKIANRWKKGQTPERAWIIRHATRTLVKNGHSNVFSLLGYTNNPKVKLNSFQLSNTKIALGQTLEFSATIKSTINKQQKFVVDYAIHYVKASGKTSAKVYKLKNVTLPPNQSISLQKKQSFKPISTRNFHSGIHRLEILINGIPAGEKSFSLSL